MKWFIEFVETVEEPKIREKIIALGAPVAGMEVTVDDGGYFFGDVLYVSRDGKFFFNEKQVHPRKWRNIAVFESSKTPINARAAVERLFDLGKIRVTREEFLTVEVGKVRLENFGNLAINTVMQPVPGSYYSKGSYAFKKGFPVNGEVRVSADGESFTVWEGIIGCRLTVGMGFDVSIVVGDYIEQRVGKVPTTSSVYEGLSDMYLSGDYVPLAGAVKDVVSKNAKIWTGRIEYGNVKMLVRKNAIVRGVDTTWERLENLARENCLPGWTYVKLNRVPPYYRRVYGEVSTVFDVDKGMLLIKASNGYQEKYRIEKDLLLGAESLGELIKHICLS